MPIPIAAGHPVALQNPVVVRAYAALEAAGAWDPAPLEFACAGFIWVSLYLAYLPGEQAAGEVDIALHVSPYDVDASASAAARAWMQQSLYAPGILAAGADTQSRFQREYVTYGAVGAAVENWVYGPLRLADGVERIRIPARESGVVGVPGSLEIIAVFTSAGYA